MPSNRFVIMGYATIATALWNMAVPAIAASTKPTPSALTTAPNGCGALPDHVRLTEALAEVTRGGHGGIFNPSQIWVSVVDRSGIVCAVAKTGDAWPGGRLMSAQKAGTANAFSNEKLALSTANLYSAVQPGGMLFGLQQSTSLDPQMAQRGQAETFGTPTDPLIGGRIGGFSVLGGGLALYDGNNQVLGGLGVAGDTSCSDHIIAWRLRRALGFKIPKGVSLTSDDNIVHDISEGRSAGGFGHPVCSPEAKGFADGLPQGKTQTKDGSKKAD